MPAGEPTNPETAAAHWREASDEQLSIAAANIANYDGGGQRVIREEIQRRRLDPSVIRDLAHASRLEDVTRGVAIQRGFAGITMVTVFLASVLYAVVLKGEPSANPSEVFLYVAFVAGVPFLAWLRQAYVNLRLVGSRTTRFALGWAIGSWVIPILNLWRPYQIMSDLWSRSSTLNADAHPAATRSVVLTLWWIAFVTWRLIDGFVALSSIRGNVSLVTTSQILAVVAGGLAIYLVVTINEAQKRFPKSLPVSPLPKELGL